MSNRTIFILALLAIIFTTLKSSIFIVHETELAIKFKFGEIIQTDYKPGVYFKIPVVHDVVKFDNRILSLDTQDARFLTIEKKNVVVNSFVKWKIVDARTFYTSTGGDERRAIMRMSQIIDNEMKSQIGAKTMKQVISGKRAEIMHAVTQNAGIKIKDFGIELIDVRVKKVELPPEVSLNVYARMSTERETVAKEFRSRGEEKAKQIRANAERQREEILAESYRKSEQIRGEGDALAAKTYARSYNQDKEFYSFYRSLKAYESVFAHNQDILILSPDSDFFKHFKKSTSR